MRGTPLFACAMALGLVTAGCLSGDEGQGEPGTPGSDVEPSEPISAKAAASTAMDWARSNWEQDADLVLASAIEAGPNSSGLRSAQRAGTSPYPMVADHDRGDGKVSIWLFNLWSPSSREMRTLAVTAGGTNVYDHRGGRASNQPATLGNWTVDSTKAAAVAMEEANFSRAADASDATVFYTLSIREDRPVWQLRAFSAAAGANTWNFIDARTAKSYTTGERQIQPVTHDDLGGNLTAEQSNATHLAPFEAGHNALEASVTWQTARANTTGEDGASSTNGTTGEAAAGNVTVDLRLMVQGETVEPATVDRSNGTLVVLWTGLDTRRAAVIVEADGLVDGDRVSYELSLETRTE